jgi:AraC-like DNA-binding protein
MEPGELHTTTCVYEPADFFNLFISPELFQQTAEEQGIHGQVHFQFPKIFTDPMLLHAIRGLVNAIRVFETPLEQQSWLALCLQGMQAYSERVPLVPSGRNDGSAIKVAKAHLQERYQDPVDLEQLSALTGLSRFSLVHSFSRQVGMPPHAFQTHVRIEKARALLEVGIPPAMVAADVGFFDQSHLNRHFKRIMQVTPGQYARASCRTKIFS